MDRERELASKIQLAANHIHTRSMKGSADYVITSRLLADTILNFSNFNNRGDKIKNILEKINNGKKYL